MISYMLLVPEILTVLLGLLLLVLGLILVQRGQQIVGFMAAAGLGAILVLIMTNFCCQQSFFGGIYQIDPLGSFFKLLFLSAAMLVFAMAGHYSEFFGQRRSEWYSFMVIATVGMMIMVSAGDLITLYIGMELMTISFYILSAYLLNSKLSAEAGLKYLILGAFSSAILLMGMSLVYAVSGSTLFTEIYQSINTSTGMEALLVAGIILLIAGFAFKIAVVPFHMWAPDIYQGAPTPVTAFLAVASKAAGFAALLRILMVALPSAAFNRSLVLAVLAALSIIIGNLVALVQQDVKRLLAYSSIAQAGYLLVGLVAANTLGIEGLIFYAMLYVFSNVGAFAVTTAVEVETGSTELESFQGLAHRSPLLAGVMTVCLLSLAGIPPLAGFVGKFYLFSGAVESGYMWLALLGLIMSMISVYYYLNVARVIYIGTAANTSPISLSIPALLCIWLCLGFTLFIGIYPGPLSQLTELAIQALL